MIFDLLKYSKIKLIRKEFLQRYVTITIEKKKQKNNNNPLNYFKLF